MPPQIAAMARRSRNWRTDIKFVVSSRLDRDLPLLRHHLFDKRIDLLRGTREYGDISVLENRSLYERGIFSHRIEQLSVSDACGIKTQLAVGWLFRSHHIARRCSHL